MLVQVVVAACIALLALGSLDPLAVVEGVDQGAEKAHGDDTDDLAGPDQPLIDPDTGSPLPTYFMINGRKIPIRYDNEGHPFQPTIDEINAAAAAAVTLEDPILRGSAKLSQDQGVQMRKRMLMGETLQKANLLLPAVGSGARSYLGLGEMQPVSWVYGVGALFCLVVVGGCCFNFVCRKVLIVPLLQSSTAPKFSTKGNPDKFQNGGFANEFPSSHTSLDKLRVRVMGANHHNWSKKLDAAC